MGASPNGKIQKQCGGRTMTAMLFKLHEMLRANNLYILFYFKLRDTKITNINAKTHL